MKHWLFLIESALAPPLGLMIGVLTGQALGHLWRHLVHHGIP